MRIAIATALVLLASACAHEDASQSSPANSAEPMIASGVSSASPAPTQAPIPPPIDDKLVPIEEDFEPEANREISPKNLESELDQLEKEINAPPPKPPAGKERPAQGQ